MKILLNKLPVLAALCYIFNYKKIVSLNFSLDTIIHSGVH